MMDDLTDPLRVRVLLSLPRPVPAQHFLGFSLVPAVFMFFLAASYGSSSNASAAHVLSPVLLTVFASMFFQVPHLFQYDAFLRTLNALPHIPDTAAEYFRLEVRLHRLVDYLCYFNGFLAATFFVLIHQLSLQGFCIALSLVLFVAASFTIYCANQESLAALEHYADSLVGLEFLEEDHESVS